MSFFSRQVLSCHQARYMFNIILMRPIASPGSLDSHQTEVESHDMQNLKFHLFEAFEPIMPLAHIKLNQSSDATSFKTALNLTLVVFTSEYSFYGCYFCGHLHHGDEGGADARLDEKWKNERRIKSE